jgi:hypothetical protein
MPPWSFASKMQDLKQRWLTLSSFTPWAICTALSILVESLQSETKKHHSLQLCVWPGLTLIRFYFLCEQFSIEPLTCNLWVQWPWTWLWPALEVVLEERRHAFLRPPIDLGPEWPTPHHLTPPPKQVCVFISSSMTATWFDGRQYQHCEFVKDNDLSLISSRDVPKLSSFWWVHTSCLPTI